MRSTAPSPHRPTQSWPRRHPVATSLLILVGALVALSVAIPGDEGDESRGVVFLGMLILATPIVIVVLLVTWLLDRRAARAAATTDEDDGPATFSAPVWPPAAAPVTPRDASSLWRSKPVDDAPLDVARSSPTGASPLSGAAPPVSSLQRVGESTLAPDALLDEATHVRTPTVPVLDPSDLRPIPLSAIQSMDPTEFEQLCVRLLLDLGYSGLRRSDDDGDLSADIVGTDRQGRSVVVECKRYDGDTVGSPAIESMIGVMATHRADRGILMTTAEFPLPAVDLAIRHDLVLIDGNDLVKLLNLTGSR